MGEASKGSDLCAAAVPIVHRAVRQLAGRHRLRSCDRDDLRQEIYLALLRNWTHAAPPVLSRGAPSAGGASGRAQDARPSARLNADLTREVDRLAGSLVRSRPSRRRERPLSPSLANVTAARPSSCRPDAHDLRLDVAVALALLPDDLREGCRRLTLTAIAGCHPQQLDANAPAEVQAQAVALRLLFTSLDLHHYL